MLLKLNKNNFFQRFTIENNHTIMYNTKCLLPTTAHSGIKPFKQMNLPILISGMKQFQFRGVGMVIFFLFIQWFEIT